MRRVYWLILCCTLVSSALATTPSGRLTIVGIARDGKPVSSAGDISLRSSSGAPVGNAAVHVGDAVPDGTQIDVPADDALVVASGKSRITIEPRTTVSLDYTGTAQTRGSETATLATGKVDVDDPLGFYQVVSHSVLLSHHTTLFSVDASGKFLIVKCKQGTVTAALAAAASGSGAGSAPLGLGYVRRVDVLRATVRSSITYALGKQTTANVSLADDEARARQGEADAAFDLASRSSALGGFERVAQTGDPYAEAFLGYVYEFGVGVPMDARRALSYYERSARSGNAFGEAGVGYAYETGSGVVRDYATARRYLERSALQGNSYGESNLAAVYTFGWGVSQNYAAALHYDELSATQGNAYAQSDLGYLYENGFGVTRDYAQALHYYELSAAQGNPYGEAGLGFLYELGHGVAQNFHIALQYLQTSADQGNGFGQFAIGLAYAQGRGVPQSYATALRYFTLSAQQRNPYGERAMGYMYENGRGVVQDTAAALRWYERSLQDGDPDSAADVRRLQSEVEPSPSPHPLPQRMSVG